MLTISFPQSAFAQGDMVSADVQAFGTVTVESDLSQSSISLDVNGSDSVDLGSVNAPGFYSERFLSDPDESDWVLGFFPSSDTQYDLVPFQASEPVAGPSDLVTHFKQGFTTDRIKDAYNKVGPNWIAAHAVAGSTVLLVCALALSMPEVIVTWTMCGKGLAGEAEDLAATILGEMLNSMNADGLLTDIERDALLLNLKQANLLVQLSLSSDQIDFIFTLVGGAANEVIQGDNLKLGFKFTEDFTKKFLFLIDLKDKLP